MVGVAQQWRRNATQIYLSTDIFTLDLTGSQQISATLSPTVFLWNMNIHLHIPTYILSTPSTNIWFVWLCLNSFVYIFFDVLVFLFVFHFVLISSNMTSPSSRWQVVQENELAELSFLPKFSIQTIFLAIIRNLLRLLTHPLLERKWILFFPFFSSDFCDCRAVPGLS